jgi:transposase
MAERGDVDLAFAGHVRRRFYVLAAAGAAPIASDALTRIIALYEIETHIRRTSAAAAPTRDARCASIIVDELESWVRGKLQMISQKTKLAEAIRYALSRWKDLTGFIDDGCIDIDSNVLERSIRR